MPKASFLEAERAYPGAYKIGWVLDVGRIKTVSGVREALEYDYTAEVEVLAQVDIGNRNYRVRDVLDNGNIQVVWDPIGPRKPNGHLSKWWRLCIWRWYVPNDSEAWLNNGRIKVADDACNRLPFLEYFICIR